jgi:hypothetical protein
MAGDMRGEIPQKRQATFVVPVRPNHRFPLASGGFSGNNRGGALREEPWFQVLTMSD